MSTHQDIPPTPATSAMLSSTSMTNTTPYRQIRALLTKDNEGTPLITVYQAYNATIAHAATNDQRLDASESFKLTRMTWIKPSWCWMMYRCGYSYKDKNQEHVLALRMKLEEFWNVLRKAELTTHDRKEFDASELGKKEENRGKGGQRERKDGDMKVKSEKVKVQWDPERDARLEKLGYRSIQIGIPAALAAEWVKENIVDITDVTLAARQLKETLDKQPEVTNEELIRSGLLPAEVVVDVPADVRQILQMDVER